MVSKLAILIIPLLLILNMLGIHFFIVFIFVISLQAFFDVFFELKEYSLTLQVKHSQQSLELPIYSQQSPSPNFFHAVKSLIRS